LGDKYYFSVKAVDSAGLVCDSVNSKGMLITSCTTDINQISKNENEITVYPNPNNGSFIIEFESGTALKQPIQIYDMNGKLVLSQIINGKTSIDASNLSEGVYNLTIISNEVVVNKRLIIVK